jgi:hypothetical protein
MLVFLEKVFHTYISGNQAVYTEDAHADLLGSTDRVMFTIIVTGISGSPIITAQVEHSANGSRWMNADATPELPNVPIPNPVTLVMSSVSGPTLAKRRLRITLSGTTPAASLLIWANGRDF